MISKDQTVDLTSKRLKQVERASKELSNAFYRPFLALLVSELLTNESENVEISKILPFLTPDDVIFYFIEK